MEFASLGVGQFSQAIAVSSDAGIYFSTKNWLDYIPILRTKSFRVHVKPGELPLINVTGQGGTVKYKHLSNIWHQ